MPAHPYRRLTKITSVKSERHPLIVVRGVHLKPESALLHARHRKFERAFEGPVKIEHLTCDDGKGRIAGRWEGARLPLKPVNITQAEQDEFAENGCEIMRALCHEPAIEDTLQPDL